MKRFCLVLLFFSSLCMPAQESEAYRRRVDSLKAIVEAGTRDTALVKALNVLSMLAWRKSNYEESDSYAKRALALAEKDGFENGVANALNNLGTIAWYKGDYKVALDQYLLSLTIMEKLKNQKGLSDAYNNVGMVHHSLGNYDKTIEYYRKSLEIDESLGMRAGVALSHINIGGVNEEMGSLLAEQGDVAGASAKFSEALKEYLQAQTIAEELNDKEDLALCYSNLGNVYSEIGVVNQRAGKKGEEFYNRSIKFHEKAIGVRTELADQYGIAGSHNFLGEVYNNLRQYDTAIAHFKTALTIGEKLGAKERIKYAYSGLASAYEKKNDLERSFEYRLLFTGMKDSIYNDELTGQIAGMQTKYETEKKEQQISLLNRDQDIRNAQLNRQQVIIWSAVIILLVVVGSGIFVYNRFHLAKRQKRIIEAQKMQVDRAFHQLHEKNQEVIDSIHYARRIQRALITPEKYIERVLTKLNKS